MGAAEHHHIGAPAGRLDKGGGDLGEDAGVIATGFRRHRRFGERRQAGWRRRGYVHVCREALDEVARIVARHGAGRREHADEADSRLFRRRLDRRDRADEGKAVARPQIAAGPASKRCCRRSTARSGGRSATTARITASTRPHQPGVANVAIGKAGVVGDVDDVGVRARLAHRLEDRQAAKAESKTTIRGMSRQATGFSGGESAWTCCAAAMPFSEKAPSGSLFGR